MYVMCIWQQQAWSIAFERFIFLLQWYKFDLEDVTKCKKEEAITGNYGGTIDSEFVFKRQTVTNSTSAYALVYIKKSLIHQTVCTLP